MSDLEKTAQVVYESCYGRNLHPGQVSSIVRGLDEAGLLAPDLPRPTRDRLWQTSALELGIRTVHYAADQVVVHTSGGRLHAHYKQARDLAMALLAAADYAEKEQGNG